MYLLPSLFTVGNIALGYYSITETLKAITGDAHSVADCVREIEEVLGPLVVPQNGAGAGWSGEAQAGAAHGDYSAAWAEYYRQLQLLPEDQQKAAIEAAQAQYAAATAAAAAAAQAQQMTPDQYAQWQAYYASQTAAQQHQHPGSGAQ